MNNFKNELKYQWRQLKAAVKGGYQEVRKLLVFKDLVDKFKEGLEIIKDDRKYKKEQYAYRNKEILQPNDIVEFRDPDCLGNIIKGKVIRVKYEFILEAVEIQLVVIESGLRYKEPVMFIYQDQILNNLVNIEQPNINK